MQFALKFAIIICIAKTRVIMAKKKNLVYIKEYKRSRANNHKFVLLVVFFVACLLAGYFFSLSSFFAIDTIKVEGNQQVSDERVIALSGIEKGRNIFKINEQELSQWLKIEPLLAGATVSRKLPGTLIIKVEEREATAIIATGRAFIWLDQQRMVISRFVKMDSFDVPLLTGLSDFDNSVMPGTYVKNESVDQAIVLLKQMTDEMRSQISEVNVADPQKIIIYTKDGVEVRLGDGEDFEEKYILYTAIIADRTTNGDIRQIAYIDVAVLDKPVISYN